MNFLNGGILWALPLLGAPFLIHLLTRRPPKKILFSHIAWIMEAHQKTMPRKKLKDILLLLLRSLLVLFLVLFFARPVWHSNRLFGQGSSRGALVFLVDTSASMGTTVSGRPAMDFIRTDLQSLLRKIPADISTGLIVFSDGIDKEMELSRDRSRLLSTLESVSAKPRPTNIAPALKAAYQQLSHEPRGQKSIVIVSDVAEHGWKEAVQAAGHFENYDPSVSVVLWDALPKIADAGIKTLSLGLSEEGVLEGLAIAKKDAGADAAAWTLTLNNITVGQGALTSPGAAIDIPLKAQLPKGGAYAGEFTLPMDALPFNNSYFVAGRIPKGYRLLIVEGKSGMSPVDSESYYFKLALESPRDPRVESVEVIRPEALKQISLSAYDVIVLADVPSITDRESDLNAWVESGGGLFVTAGSKWANSPAMPIKYFRRLADLPAAVMAGQTILAPENNFSGFEWKEITVSKHISVEPNAAHTVILKLANGEALLVEKKVGKGAVLLLTTSLDRAWTNFPGKPAFAPLMREIMATLADPYRDQTSLMGLVGQPIRLQAPVGIHAVSVTAPDGSSVAGQIDQNGQLSLPALSMPGLYRAKTDKPEKDFTFAVNIPSMDEESDLTRLKESSARAAFPNASVEWIAGSSGAVDQVAGALQGRDMSTVFLWAIFIVFVLESLLAGVWKSSSPFRGRLGGGVATAAFLLILCVRPLSAAGNDFVYQQLQYNGAWDPYPEAHENILQMLHAMTNIPMTNARRVVTLKDESLFESPFLLVKGNGALPFTMDEKTKLKQYIDRGGFIFFDDTLADTHGPFADSVRALMKELYPDRSFQKLPIDHALFRSFFLLRTVSGRRMSDRAFEGLDLGNASGGEGRTAVIYCPNDLLGAWMKDHLGAYAFTCEPGGESQRWDAFKLTVNVIYFSLTGTYKKDAIHQPFIEQKLGS